MDRKIVLVKEVHTTDAIGQIVPIFTTSSVWANVQSVTRAEWNAAGGMGITPSYVLKLQSVNYEGQKLVDIDNKRYSVYRTYVDETMDQTEVYVEEKAGTR